MSDKEFRENTKAPTNVIGEEALAITLCKHGRSLGKTWRDQLQHLKIILKMTRLKTSLHPVFGELNFEEWVLLHYKHVTHHLRQFGLL